jgi:amino acid permease
MFDTIKALFLSIYGALIFVPFFVGSMWCIFAYGLFGLIYPSMFVITLSLVLYKRERNREKALAKTDLQIDTEKQAKAIDEYVELINKQQEKKQKH